MSLSGISIGVDPQKLSFHSVPKNLGIQNFDLIIRHINQATLIATAEELCQLKIRLFEAIIAAIASYKDISVLTINYFIAYLFEIQTLKISKADLCATAKFLRYCALAKDDPAVDIYGALTIYTALYLELGKIRGEVGNLRAFSKTFVKKEQEKFFKVLLEHTADFAPSGNLEFLLNHAHYETIYPETLLMDPANPSVTNDYKLMVIGLLSHEKINLFEFRHWRILLNYYSSLFQLTSSDKAYLQESLRKTFFQNKMKFSIGDDFVRILAEISYEEAKTLIKDFNAELKKAGVLRVLEYSRPELCTASFKASLLTEGQNSVKLRNFQERLIEDLQRDNPSIQTYFYLLLFKCVYFNLNLEQPYELKETTLQDAQWLCNIMQSMPFRSDDLVVQPLEQHLKLSSCYLPDGSVTLSPQFWSQISPINRYFFDFYIIKFLHQITRVDSIIFNAVCTRLSSLFIMQDDFSSQSLAKSSVAETSVDRSVQLTVESYIFYQNLLLELLRKNGKEYFLPEHLLILSPLLTSGMGLDTLNKILTLLPGSQPASAISHCSSVVSDAAEAYSGMLSSMTSAAVSAPATTEGEKAILLTKRAAIDSLAFVAKKEECQNLVKNLLNIPLVKKMFLETVEMHSPSHVEILLRIPGIINSDHWYSADKKVTSEKPKIKFLSVLLAEELIFNLEQSFYSYVKYSSDTNKLKYIELFKEQNQKIHSNLSALFTNDTLNILIDLIEKPYKPVIIENHFSSSVESGSYAPSAPPKEMFDTKAYPVPSAPPADTTNQLPQNNADGSPAGGMYVPSAPPADEAQRYPTIPADEAQHYRGITVTITDLRLPVVIPAPAEPAAAIPEPVAATPEPAPATIEPVAQEPAAAPAPAPVAATPELVEAPTRGNSCCFWPWSRKKPTEGAAPSNDQ